LAVGATMNHERVRPCTSHISSWSARRSSTRQAANSSTSARATCRAWASVDGRPINHRSSQRSMRNTPPV
jgi:hypothetical protein